MLHDCYLGESYFPLASIGELFPSCSDPALNIFFSCERQELAVTVTLCDDSCWGKIPKLKARGFRQCEVLSPFFDEEWLELVLPQAGAGLCALTSVS